MGFFSDDKPHVSKDEFKKVRTTLYDKGWSSKELDLLETFFSGSMDEETESQKGLDKDEIEQGLKTLRENENLYHFSEQKLVDLEETLFKYL